jgi:PleD family two-component response regulator
VSCCRGVWQEGHRIVEAENGRSALDRIAVEPFDLILLDMMMPDINGYEVLTQLKADTRYSDIPVIIISALDEIDGIVRCIEAGAEYYLQYCCGRASARRWRKRSCAIEKGGRRRTQGRERKIGNSPSKYPPQVDHCADAPR